MQQEHRQRGAVGRRHGAAAAQPGEPGEEQRRQPGLGQRQADRRRRRRVEVRPRGAAHPDRRRREAADRDQQQHARDAADEQDQCRSPGQRPAGQRDAELPGHPPAGEHRRAGRPGDRCQDGQPDRDGDRPGAEPVVQPEEQRGGRQQGQVHAEEPQWAQRQHHDRPHQPLRGAVQGQGHCDGGDRADQRTHRYGQRPDPPPPPAQAAVRRARPAARGTEAGDQEEQPEGLEQPARRAEGGHRAQRAVQPHGAVDQRGRGDQPVADHHTGRRDDAQRVHPRVAAHRAASCSSRQTATRPLSDADPGRK